MPKKKTPTKSNATATVGAGHEAPNATLSDAKKHPTGTAPSAWDQFDGRHPGHPGLEDDAIYALPLGLIDAIRERLPKFWTPSAEAFERDLSASAGLGFFLRHPIEFPSLDESPQPIGESEPARSRTSRLAAVTSKITHLLAGELDRQGRDGIEHSSYFAKADEMRRKIAERQLSYAGWLVTNPDFHRDRDRFRTRWKARIRKRVCFPRFPVSLMGERPPKIRKSEREFYDEYLLFYQRWGLDTMATWDLPVPMRPELTTPSLFHLTQIGEAGVVMFVPWYLLRDKDITLRDIAEHHRLLEAPNGLSVWLDGVPKNWGHDRNRLMLELYVYLELCLRRRYADRLRRGVERLDLAISRFLTMRKPGPPASDQMAETVKRVRLEIKRRLTA